jgi:hypothetical protein
MQFQNECAKTISSIQAGGRLKRSQRRADKREWNAHTKERKAEN